MKLGISSNNPLFCTKENNEIQTIIDLIKKEDKRQKSCINLIASENTVSKDVLNAQGSILTNKYAEGYPDRRYYGGCENVDIIEKKAINLACKLFNAKFANVQPHCGSSANMAVFEALLQPGDTILSMSLKDGGHLTHGAPVSFSGVRYNVKHYELDPETHTIDYTKMEEMCKELQPKLIIAGGSAYPRLIDFALIREICDKYNIIFMVDMAHFAGLVAASLVPNPINYADVITSTTHKTLRGPRGGIILTNREDYISKINKAIFPGIQGGPLMHVIAAKAICFAEALEPEFVDYQRQVMKNIKTMEEVFRNNNVKMISDGTDTHLLLIDVMSTYGISGKVAQERLEHINIYVNKNGIVGDTLSPQLASGIRIGTPFITSLGADENDCKIIAKTIDEYLKVISKDIDHMASLEETAYFKEALTKITNKFKSRD